MADDIIQKRKAKTDHKLELVRAAFTSHLGENFERIIGEHTTIYVTGSCGRGDMGAASDLDPYVVRFEDAPETAASSSQASQRIEASLIFAAAESDLGELDANGDHAKLVPAASLFENLGSPLDDESGAFTKRMLLLLESRPLINESGYDRLLESTISAYWKNADQHPDDYLPIVLLNDIVRYWRILLLNHESRLTKKAAAKQLSQDQLMALRRYSSYKLRVPRCLSCFSALAYMLALTPSEPAHVKREDILQMSRMTPLDRLESLRGKPDAPNATLDELRRLYVEFLIRTDGGKTSLTDQLMKDASFVQDVSFDGREFTRHMFELVQSLGGGRTLHRAIVV